MSSQNSESSEINSSISKVNCDILRDVYKILVDGNVLNTKTSDMIVDFKFPSELMGILDLSIPNNADDMDAEKIRHICEMVVKYSLKTSHPNFHNQLFGGVDVVGLAGAWITDALNTSQYTFEVSPVFTLMENEVIQTFCKMFGFDNGDGIFTPGGSLSNMYGMVLARYKMVPNIKSIGCFGKQPIVAFTSEDSHYSIQKSVHWLGIGLDNLVFIKTDDNGCMLIDDLVEKIEHVLKTDRQPFFVNATAGTTVLGAFDSLNHIADVCDKYKLWMHVDGCLGGSIIFSQQHKPLLEGISRAHSISYNAHKSLGVPLQCSMFLVKENGLLHKCNSASASYLFQQDKFYDISYDTGDKSIQCGRKVDVFKFWLMLKARGLSGFERLIDNAMNQAKYLTKKISERSNFRLVLNDFQYTNVCFWFVPPYLQMKTEDEHWWKQLYGDVPKIKENMIRKDGSLMINYSPWPSKNIGNFFRMTFTCFPPPSENSVNSLLDEIEKLGKV